MIAVTHLGVVHTGFKMLPTLTDAVPTPPKGRIITIDILRGMALFGILVVNMLSFAYPGFLYPALATPGLSSIDRYAEWFVRVFFQASFYTIFAFLFGLGFYLQMRRLEGRGLGIYLRRLLVLFAFGALHSVFLWTGDILMTYALVGMAFLFFRHAHARWLLVWGLAGVAFSTWLFWSPYSVAQLVDVPRESRAQMIRTYQEGTYAEVTQTRRIDTVSRFFGTLYGLPRFLAIFMLGLWVGRRGIIANPQAHLKLIRWTIFLGLLIGLAGKGPYAYDLLTRAFDPATSRLFHTLAINVSGPAIGVAYLGILLLALQRGFWQQRLRPLAAVGRMALSNYLLQSVVCTTLFYGYGFGLFGTVAAAWGLVIAVVIYALQVPLSMLWLSFFGFGPVEWLWRALSYGALPATGKYENANADFSDDSR